MPEIHHLSDLLDQSAITAFLKRIGFGGPTELANATGISFHTVSKWYRTEPAEMSAVDFLRIVVSTGKQDALTSWLKKIQRPQRDPAAPSAPPLPKSAMRAVTLAEKSDEKKRGPRR